MPDLITAKVLREQRHKLILDARAINDKAEKEGRDLNTEEQAAWNKIMGHVDAEGKRQDGEIDVLKRRIDRLETLEADASRRPDNRDEAGRIGRDDYDGRPDRRDAGGDGADEVTEEHRALAMQAWCRVQMDEDVTDEQRAACKLLRFNPGAKKLSVPLLRTEGHKKLVRQMRSVHPSRAVEACETVECRNLSATTLASGAALIPPETLIRALEVNMLYYGGMMQVAETIRTSSGERMSWPTADDTTNVGVQLGENTTIGSSVDPSFTKVFWDAYKFSSKPILVPYELLEDSAFNLVAVLGEMLGERLGRILNTKFTVGTGASTPKGIITAAATFAAGSATAIAFDDVLGLIHSVDPAYRTAGCGFMAHDQVVLAVRKLKDGFGRYLWEDNVQAGQPDRLKGYPFTINQDMDSTFTSGKKTLLFGRLNYYKVRTVNQIRMYRLQERYRDSDQDGFIAFIRCDGNLLTAGTSPVKVLLH